MKKKLLIFSAIIILSVLLTGCNITEPITPDSDGFWDKYIVYPLSWIITYFAELMGENYGLSLIVVTIIIRIILLPLMIKQTKSSVGMQRIQPELQELRKKYSSKDQKTQQKLQQETMKLFQQHGVNPLAGCMPLIVQMPILFGFYQAIIRTEEISNHTFLWFDLGNPDPYYILPLVAGITTYLQQKIIMGDGSVQNPQMKMMLYIMPVMIVIFAITFPAALSLYWVVGNIFMIVQSLFITGPMKNKPDKGPTGGAKK